MTSKILLTMTIVIIAAYGVMAAPIIPLPVEVRETGGAWTLQPGLTILADRGLENEAQFLAELLRKPMGKMPKIALGKRSAHSDIRLVLDASLSDLGREGYQMQISPQGALIRAAARAGVFYGIQSLRQLLPPEVEKRTYTAGVIWSVPCTEIRDVPRFAWRGALLDVSRHFFTVEEVKRFVDLLALHKQNRFHWHLTDDQGWRIEIKKYPKLTETGSWRKESPLEGNRKVGDGKRYGGFYTQKQIREVVEYAASRHITVVPEIEMPGHTKAALASYPELGCTGGPYEVRVFWGVERDVYCAGNDKVYNFVENVLSEVLRLFPSSFIHIGGDECPKDRWKECPKCRAAIKKYGLKNENELQSHFIQHFDRWLSAKGRRLIGWDEILEGGLAPGAAVMSWRGIKGGIEAATSGHDVVMSPNSHCYLDYYQAKNDEPEAIGGFLPLEKVYSYEPIPQDLAADKRARILGVQGNLWSEYLFNYPKVEYMAFPRLCALAEAAWTPPSRKNYAAFRKRLNAQLHRLDILGVKYRKPRAEDGPEK